MKELVFLFVGLLVAASAPLPAPNPGVVYEIETTFYEDAGARTEFMEMFVHGPHLLRMRTTPGSTRDAERARHEAIFRGDRQAMIAVDHAEQTYSVIDKQAMASMAKGLDAIKQIPQSMQIPKEVLDQMPEAQRKQVEEAMKQFATPDQQDEETAGTAETVIEETSERATKSGYPCVKYIGRHGGEVISEAWVTDFENIPGGGEVFEVMQSLLDFTSSLMDTFGSSASLDTGTDAFESFSKLDGFPVVTKSFVAGELESETVLRSVTERDLDPDAFEPPKGYRLRTMGPQ